MERIHDILNNIASQKKIDADIIEDDTVIMNLNPENLETKNSKDDNMIEFDEYKEQYLQMSLASLKNIVSKISGILDHSEMDHVKENLTEPWLQGMIAIVENNVNTVYDFVKFFDTSDDNSSEAANRPGLWENIRKKKEREGKNYKPAKTGEKDRPDSKTWKKLTKEKEK